MEFLSLHHDCLLDIIGFLLPDDILAMRLVSRCTNAIIHSYLVRKKVQDDPFLSSPSFSHYPLIKKFLLIESRGGIFPLLLNFRDATTVLLRCIEQRDRRNYDYFFDKICQGRQDLSLVVSFPLLVEKVISYKPIGGSSGSNETLDALLDTDDKKLAFLETTITKFAYHLGDNVIYERLISTKIGKAYSDLLNRLILPSHPRTIAYYSHVIPVATTYTEYALGIRTIETFADLVSRDGFSLVDQMRRGEEKPDEIVLVADRYDIATYAKDRLCLSEGHHPSLVKSYIHRLTLTLRYFANLRVRDWSRRLIESLH
jgi:hypothetical protein